MSLLPARIEGARLALALVTAGALIMSACTDEEKPSLGAAQEFSVARMDAVPPAELPALPIGDRHGLPERVPHGDATLPSLLQDLPGRVVVALRRDITQLNSPVESWSEIEILFFGADGGWRRLNMGDLELPEGAIPSDTYGAGALSPDGRSWMAYTRTDVIFVNLGTGEVRLQRAPHAASARWVPGRDVIVVDGFEVALGTGNLTRTPYKLTSEVGFEPDGSPLSVQRGDDGETLLVEWDAIGRRVRTLLPSLRADQRSSIGLGVVATAEHFVVSQSRGDRVADVAVVSQTGVAVGELSWPRGQLLYMDDWLDNRTLLVATEPYFLAWRPATGELFRVTDARNLDGYWDVSTALMG